MKKILMAGLCLALMGCSSASYKASAVVDTGVKHGVDLDGFANADPPECFTIEKRWSDFWRNYNVSLGEYCRAEKGADR